MSIEDYKNTSIEIVNYKVEIDGSQLMGSSSNDSDGFIDPKMAWDYEEFNPETPNGTLEDYITKSRGNARWKQLIMNICTANIYQVYDIEVTGADDITVPSKVEFKVGYETFEGIYDNDLGIELFGEDALKYKIAKTFINAYKHFNSYFDPQTVTVKGDKQSVPNACDVKQLTINPSYDADDTLSIMSDIDTLIKNISEIQNEIDELNKQLNDLTVQQPQTDELKEQELVLLGEIDSKKSDINDIEEEILNKRKDIRSKYESILGSITLTKLEESEG